MAAGATADDNCDVPLSDHGKSAEQSSPAKDGVVKPENTEKLAQLHIGYDDTSFAERIALAGLVGVDLFAAHRLFEDGNRAHTATTGNESQALSSTLATVVAEIKRLGMHDDINVVIEYGTCVCARVELNPVVAAEKLIRSDSVSGAAGEQPSERACHTTRNASDVEAGGAVPFTVCACGACGPGTLPTGVHRVVSMRCKSVVATFWQMCIILRATPRSHCISSARAGACPGCPAQFLGHG